MTRLLVLISLLGLALGQYSYRQDRASSFLLQVKNNDANNSNTFPEALDSLFHWSLRHLLNVELSFPKRYDQTSVSDPEH